MKQKRPVWLPKSPAGMVLQLGKKKVVCGRTMTLHKSRIGERILP